MFELVRMPDFANLPLVVEDFVKDSGGSYTGKMTRQHTCSSSLKPHTKTLSCLSVCFPASQEDAVHVVIDRHLITGQNMQSTSLAVNNLILLCSAK